MSRKKRQIKIHVYKTNELYLWVVFFPNLQGPAFEIQVLRALAIKCRGKFRILSLPRQCVSKKTAEDFAETFLYHVSNGFSISQHFAKDYDLVFNSWYYLFYEYDTLKREKQKSIFLPLITLFWFLCYNRRTHYPTLQTPGKQHVKTEVSNANWVITEN